MKSFENKTLILDVCGTIYKGNSTLDFISFIKYENKCNYLKFRFKKISNRVLRRLGGISPKKFKEKNDKLEVLFFQGMNISYLNEKSKDFWDFNFEEGKINLKLLENKNCYCEVVLASAAMPFLVEALKNKIGATDVCCRDIYIGKDNVVNGFGSSILDNKAAILLSLYQERYKIFYSDNKEDYIHKECFDEFYYIQF
ncbi:hypothetical protein CKO50_14650 [Pseudoalteromonas sp. HM-SA03]|uniref:hypothetical protein n=1 Tax=Pseudoalteromonas sp. HM-SA03 TaxID=2029678 RepID=UPI000BAE3EB0|nr:hypothetical protein [Pseudoalteromonas sp. HM-SA03]PAY00667.1 hypothetical protein CKO50_14650 [Pseudoalteromonas sp. HM-SA03]